MYIYFFLERYPHGIFAARGALVSAQEKKTTKNLQQACFVSMDTTYINSGEKNGLKKHLEHKVPLLKWIGCNNQSLL